MAATIVDFRSDTVTRPSAAMRDAMHAAPVGDDVFGDDPTVNRLEAMCSDFLAKEAAIFVPSGTMANQLAILCHTRRGDAIVAHARSHILNYEAGAPALLSSVMCRAVDSDDGSVTADAVQAITYLGDDPHMAPTRLICVENTHNGCGGRVLSVETTAPLLAWAASVQLKTHLDGARLNNAAVALHTSARALAAGFDSVSMCFSKGLGAPIGSVLAGSREFVTEARRYRKMLGGSMRQVGGIAAAAIHALEHNVARLADDHRRAKQLANVLASLPGVRVDLANIETNLVYFELPVGHPMCHTTPGHVPILIPALLERGIHITGHHRRFRMVTHLDINDDGIARAEAALRALLG